jgi:DnaJ-domain-containing protein 1
MKCWNCQNALEELLLCGRCGMPQAVEFLGPFEALGLPPRLNWDAGALRKSYERLAARCHPDLFRAHHDERVLTAARLSMRSLNDAYRELRDPVARLRYVLAATGHLRELTRTVPEGLQESAQIIDRVLRAVEEAREKGDREAWETEQDHLAALQVQIEKAQGRSDGLHANLVAEWDQAISGRRESWPDLPDGWYEQALRWLGEHEYLDTLDRRARAGRHWEEPATASATG